MNLYEDLVAIKGDLGITGTDNDARLLALLRAASRTIDNYCDRHFYVEDETRYFDGTVPLQINDLLSIDTSGLTTDEDGDATFENTFAATDYILYPLNTFPKTKIELSVDSDYGNFGHSKKGCSIAGKWGYGDGVSATPYTDSAGDVADDPQIAAGVTTLTLSDDTYFSIGQTLRIEDEQVYITGLNKTAHTATIIRAVNGTTDADHLKDVSIYIYDYPADIEQTCLSLAEKMFATRGKGFQSERLGDYSYTMAKSSIPEPEKSLLNQYRRMK